MTTKDYTYHNLDLRTITQNDLAMKLKLNPVMVSVDPSSKTDERVLELFCFAELHHLDDLLLKLNSIYPTS